MLLEEKKKNSAAKEAAKIITTSDLASIRTMLLYREQGMNINDGVKGVHIHIYHITLPLYTLKPTDKVHKACIEGLQANIRFFHFCSYS